MPCSERSPPQRAWGALAWRLVARLRRFVGRARAERAARSRATAGDPGARERARIGRWGEQVAARHLEAKRYRIVGRRVRVGRDELDLIAVPPGERAVPLVFVEVKTRRSRDFGGPLAALDRRKRQALCRAAARYLRRLPPPPCAFRFDAVEVVGDPATLPAVRHVENAFPMAARYVTPWLAGRRFLRRRNAGRSLSQSGCAVDAAAGAAASTAHPQPNLEMAMRR